ncbi:FAD dependent oxidoreductase (plasmid) [Rhizobium leguminosarum bv. trifolii WSM2304]|uniref:FAD dependent oxidoreductase n=1 Tax=Rhizobium leguminosarum bv. trifolii (strain WSM2304) TaxID=395492 RepID=A0ABF7QZ64_RHILW|nr:FAD-binding oxidoreductase [Rhizobium leguminosarum]ACI59638.1 FAD dependent oxidoreductase [Rhizobium leguminosarum bv. trifolii WSM2304]
MADVTIIGGGIVGLCSAMALQDRGYTVEIIERGEIGRGASFGNCGLLAPGEVVPVSRPGVMKNIPRWLLDPEGPLFVRPGALARDLTWLLRFLRAGRADRVRHIASSLTPLMKRVNADYDALLEAIRRPGLLSQVENLMLFNDRAEYERDRFSWNLRSELGFDHTFISGSQVRELEPAIEGPITCGLIMKDWYHFTDPLALTQALADEVIRRGGRILLGEARSFDSERGQVRSVKLLNGGRIDTKQVVLAAGAWSGLLSRQLGMRIPLAHLSGYHVQAPHPHVHLERAIYYASGGFVLTPMATGLRIGGTIEIAGPDPKPNFRRADVLAERAKAILPTLDITGSTRWMGARPFIPDTMPIIGKAPAFDNVTLAFGHGQIGMTLGATTGQLVAQLIAHENPAVDLTPFRPQRFT